LLQHIAALFEYLDFSVWWAMLSSWVSIIVGTLLVSYASKIIAKRYLIALFDLWVDKRKSNLGHFIVKHRVFQRLTHIIPALIIYAAVPWLIIDGRPHTLTLAHVVQELAKIYIVVIVTAVLFSFTNLIEEYYRQYAISKQRPIKSYLEVLKIIIMVFAAILIGSILLNKSPVVLLTGLGAATAVISLVFRDSLLGFVASVQMATYDLVRIGDWIEVPAYGADGEVVDISLNTVKVQNWDKSMVTIPTFALTSTQMKNWRPMLDAGGRRIKRAVNLDMHSIRFCDEQLLEKLKDVEHIKEYLEQKQAEIEEHNKDLPKQLDLPINGRSFTNVGVFRAYLEYYLRSNPELHQGMTFFVRQLAPGPEGLPIEIYVFAKRTLIDEYEALQSDLFDHILAVLPYFELRVYQNATD
jgi:miniconductance mechanosensitive channel